MDHWHQNHSKSRFRFSTRQDEIHIYQHIIPQLGNNPQNQLSQDDLQRRYNYLKKSGRLRKTELYGEDLTAS